MSETSGLSRLRKHQVEAINAVETAISQDHKEITVLMGTGTGKTFTLVNLIHRLIHSSTMHRILYITDRRNLEEQTLHALRRFVSPPKTGGENLSLGKFSHPELHNNNIENKSSTILTTTYQRLLPFIRNEQNAHPKRPGAQELKSAFDAVVFDNPHFPRNQKKNAWKDAYDYFSATKVIWTTPSYEVEHSNLPHVVFEYSTKDAVEQGVLVDSRAARGRAPVQGWNNVPLGRKSPEGRRIFILHSHEDSSVATGITGVLSDEFSEVYSRDLHTQANDEFGASVLAEMRSGDVLVALLSTSSIENFWMHSELSKALDRRGVETIPALVETCQIPHGLAERRIVDASKGAASLIECLRTGFSVDLRTLTPESFEDLTLALLRRLGFTLDQPRQAPNQGYDFAVTYKDDLGFSDPTPYLVDVKSYRDWRVSVRTLMDFASLVTQHADGRHGLLVTTAQLTSVAKEALDELNREGPQLRIIDGLRFKGLLMDHPDLIAEYFSPLETDDAKP